MAKFRSNHEKQQSAAGAMTMKIGLFAAIFGAFFWVFNNFSTQTTESSESQESEATEIDVVLDNENTTRQAEEEREAEEISFDSNMPQEYLPTKTTGQVVNHEYFSFSYSEAHEQAQWVAYELTRDRLNANWEDRPSSFRPDRAVETGSASPYDYKKSGYDRGHLVPAADMAFDLQAITETFYMSNISPQKSGFNKGIWRELEEQSRDWAKKFKHLYVVVGPLFKANPLEYIGENKVAVPTAFFKILLDVSDPDYKAIAFVIPNEVSFKHINEYAVSIDKVEKLTGFDFFSDLMEDDVEEKLEAMTDPTLWKSSENRYQARLEKWNQ